MLSLYKIKIGEYLILLALTSTIPAGQLGAGSRTSPLASFVLRESGLGGDPWKQRFNMSLADLSNVVLS